MRFEEERINSCIRDIEPLIWEHWHEIAEDKESIPLDPDYERYLAMENLNLVHVFTARDGDELVGYFITFIGPHMHYRSTVFGVNDIMYLKPEYRKGSTGLRLVRGAMNALRAKGVEKLIIHMKVKHPFRSLLQRMGFNLIEENWGVTL